jgi:hypothetical protein
MSYVADLTTEQRGYTRQGQKLTLLLKGITR